MRPARSFQRTHCGSSRASFASRNSMGSHRPIASETYCRPAARAREVSKRCGTRPDGFSFRRDCVQFRQAHWSPKSSPERYFAFLIENIINYAPAEKLDYSREEITIHLRYNLIDGSQNVYEYIIDLPFIRERDRLWGKWYQRSHSTSKASCSGSQTLLFKPYRSPFFGRNLCKEPSGTLYLIYMDIFTNSY